MGSWLHIWVPSPGSVAWGWICVCVSGIWRLCGCGFVSWVCVWGPCAALALGSDVWNLVSRVLCQSLVSSVWHSRLMVLLGSFGQFGIRARSGVQLLVLGLLRGTGSGLRASVLVTEQTGRKDEQCTITERTPPLSLGVPPTPTRFAMPATRGKTSLNARDW